MVEGMGGYGWVTGDPFTTQERESQRMETAGVPPAADRPPTDNADPRQPNRPPARHPSTDFTAARAVTLFNRFYSRCSFHKNDRFVSDTEWERWRRWCQRLSACWNPSAARGAA
jgi:hypothetical protein